MTTYKERLQLVKEVYRNLSESSAWDGVAASDEFGSGDSGIKCFCMATFVGIAH